MFECDSARMIEFLYQGGSGKMGCLGVMRQKHQWLHALCVCSFYHIYMEIGTVLVWGEGVDSC